MRGDPHAKAVVMAEGLGTGAPLYEDRLLQIILVEEPPGLRLIGQADLSHRAVLQSALRRAEQGMSDVLVDMADLEFIDVGGVRQVIDLAAVLALDGRQVLISGVRPSVQRIFQVCLWPQPENLSIKLTNGNDLSYREARAHRGAPLTGDLEEGAGAK